MNYCPLCGSYIDSILGCDCGYFLRRLEVVAEIREYEVIE